MGCVQRGDSFSELVLAVSVRGNRVIDLSVDTHPVFLAMPADRPSGVALAVKDLFDTAGLRTTYGSRIFAGHVPERSAEAVARLESSGFGVVGKTNLCEFAYGITSRNALGHRVMAPSTLGTFLRAFTFGHVRQLDRVLDVAVARAWAAGAGPGDRPLVLDLDGFIGEVHGYQKQGAGYGYTRRYGYHPLLAVRSDTGEVIHIRNRKGSANTQRGVERFVDELLARVARAGHAGQVVIRADSGFENHRLMRTLAKRGVEFSIAVEQSQTIRTLIEQIPDTAWRTVADYSPRGEAQVAETRLKRLAVDRPPHPPERRDAGRAVARLAPPRLRDQPHPPGAHRRHRSPRPRRDRTDDPRPQRPSAGALPSGQMNANSAWTVIAALAHNLARWTTLIGLPDRPVQTAQTRRRQLRTIPGRLVRTARQWTLRLPAHWPGQTNFLTVLHRLRALPALT